LRNPILNVKAILAAPCIWHTASHHRHLHHHQNPLQHFVPQTPAADVKEKRERGAKVINTNWAFWALYKSQSLTYLLTYLLAYLHIHAYLCNENDDESKGETRGGKREEKTLWIEI